MYAYLIFPGSPLSEALVKAKAQVAAGGVSEFEVSVYVPRNLVN